MRTDKYPIKDFLSYPGLEQLVIPEIQRDYVWEKEHILDLLSTFKEGFNGTIQDRPYLGFIYAYTDKDHPYKYFIVDGQQRLTSIYLVLVLCYQLLNKSLPNYLQESGKAKLDYKVRQATHDFLIRLVNHCEANLSDHDFLIEDQTWFHSKYRNDKTIGNLTQNFYAVREALREMDPEDILRFTRYIEREVQLSYFNIESGREGEELYIYMNARGKQLEINETLKAKYLGKIPDEERLGWGAKWEQWQDFFWKHKGGNTDADAGFDEFLRRVQILHMCALGGSNDLISHFSSEKSELKIDTAHLPNNLNELEAYFNAYKLLAESIVVSDFYEKYEGSRNYLTETPVAKRRQIYYFVTLPILAFVKESKEANELVIKKFVRFFYNISRKSNIGKDISAHLPSAIKLVQEYVKAKPAMFDVVGLRQHGKGRTVLLNDEELYKLNFYEKPPKEVTREELEVFFWSAEDHPIFNGEISFLLQNEKFEYDFTLTRATKHFATFETLFPQEKVKTNNTSLIRTLLFYGNTWFQDTPYYYKNYDCADWYSLVRNTSGKYLKLLLDDMYGKPINHLDNIVEDKINLYFLEHSLDNIEKIKVVDGFLDQVKILAAIDYYSDKIIWVNQNFYIAEDPRFTFDTETFFSKDRLLYNIPRYIGDGFSNRILSKLQSRLNAENISKIINKILAKTINT